MQGRKEGRPLFIEDLTLLEVLFKNTEFNYVVARNTLSQECFLLAEHLALTLDANSINVSLKKFNDPSFERAKRDELLSLYNPFRPEQYEFCIEEVHVNNAKSPTHSYHLYKGQTATHSRDNQYFAIDPVYPWIGINLTKQYGLTFSGTYYSNNLVSEKESETKEKIAAFLAEWQQLKANSNLSQTLQDILKEKQDTHKKNLERKLKESELRKNRNNLILAIKRTEAYKTFLSYTNSLASKNDNAKEKADIFGGFLKKLQVDMDAQEFDDWMQDVTCFDIKFKTNFTPRPGMGAASSPKTTECYKCFMGLQKQVSAILILHSQNVVKRDSSTITYSPQHP